MNKHNSGNVPAFPAPEAGFEHFSQHSAYMGMTIRDYAAIKFAAAWVQALGGIQMSESRDALAVECLRLGLFQADYMFPTNPGEAPE